MRLVALRGLVRQGVLFALASAAYLMIRYFGLALPAATVPGQSTLSASVSADVLGPVMIALAVVTLASQGLGAIGKRWFGQPPVIGEILAGILLGPSLLGALSPPVYSMLFPTEVIPALGIVAKIGVVLFMFVIGLEIDLSSLRRTSRATLAISNAGIVLPFLLGAALALLLYPRYGSAAVGFTAFSLFVGVSLSLTAFPVLARILREFQVEHTQFGTTALACAAIGDISAWTLLALIVGIVTRDVARAMTTIPLVAIYLVSMLFIVGPLLRQLSRGLHAEGGPISNRALTFVFVGLMVSAAITEFIGIHALFGAFFFGLLLPHDGGLARALRTRVEDLVSILFLPAFFAFTGLRTKIGLIESWDDWLACGLIILVATAGKFVGTYAAARFTGIGRREATAFGVLMNTRGLVELIVLNVGLDLGVLSPRLFAMLVLMALVTTFATSPMFGWIIRMPRFNPALTIASWKVT